MSGKVTFDLSALEAGARNADALGQTFAELGNHVRGVPLQGLEPETRGRTEAAVQRAAELSRRACQTAERQGPALRRRSALARRADAAGGALLHFGGEFWKNFKEPPNAYDLGGYLDSIRDGARSALREIPADSRQARRKLGRAIELYNRQDQAWRRRRWTSPEVMRKELRRPNSPYNKQLKRLKGLEKRTRFLDAPEKLIDKLPKGLGKVPLVKRIPAISTAFGYAGAKSEGRSDVDAAGKTAAQTAGSAAGAALGGAACGTAAAATLGLGAATCPVLIFAGGAVGDKVAGALYDPVKKVGGKVVHGAGNLIKGIPNPLKHIHSLSDGEHSDHKQAVPMTAQLFNDIALELPDEWVLADEPTDGALIQAMAPEGGDFRPNVTVQVYPRTDDGEGEAAIDAFHEQQLLSMAQTMTDALVVDDAATTVAGYPARQSVIAFRQGYFTVTCLMWTIQAPGAAVVVAGMTDIDQLPVDRELFDALVESIKFDVGAQA